MRTSVLAIMSSLVVVTTGAVQAADLQSVSPAAEAEASAVSAAPAAATRDVGLPCLFACEGYERQAVWPSEPVAAPQTAAAPASVAAPAEDADTAPEVVHHRRTKHAFAQASSPNREGRSISVAPKVSRPHVVRHTAVVTPSYDMPLDSSAMPSTWQLRAGPTTVPGPVPAAKAGPWGTLKGF